MMSHLISEKEYEEAYYAACNDVYGPRGYTEVPAGVLATYESQRFQIEQVYFAGCALQQSANSGNESAKFMLSEHWKAQEMSHYRSKEDARRFYTKTLNQSKDHEQYFLQNAILMERSRISHDQMTRILLGQIKASSNALPQMLTVSGSNSTHVSHGVAKKFACTKLHEDCKLAIREMVLRNPIEFMFTKSVRKYISQFVVHPLCPMEGISIDERVSYTNVHYVDLWER